MSDNVFSLSSLREEKETQKEKNKRNGFLRLFTTVLVLPPKEVERINRKYGGN